MHDTWEPCPWVESRDHHEGCSSFSLQLCRSPQYDNILPFGWLFSLSKRFQLSITTTSSKKTASKQNNLFLVDNEELAELAELVKPVVAEAMKEAIPKFEEDVVAQLSAKTQAMVAEQMSEFRSEMVETNETHLSAV